MQEPGPSAGAPFPPSPAPGAASPAPRPEAIDGGEGPGPGDRARDGRFRSLLMYGASRGVSNGLLSFRGLVVATLLGPTGFGGWTLFRLALKYGALASFGTLQGTELAVAQGDARTSAPAAVPAEGPGPGPGDGDRKARTALGFKLFVFLFLSAAALAASFVATDPDWVLGLRGLAVAVLADRLWNYGIVYLRSKARVRRYSVLEVVSALLHLALTSLGAWIWGLGGAFGGFAAASLASAALLAREVPIRPRLDVADLGWLLRVGFPVMVAVSLTMALKTADRLVVAAFGGTTMLGHYAFAAAVAGMALAAVWAVRTVVFPDVYGSAETRGAGRAVQDHLSETLLPFARLFPPLLGLAAFGIAPAVQTFLPEYREAIAPARLFLFTGVTFGYASLGSLGVVAADRQRLLPVLGGATLVLNVGLSLAALKLGIGLEGVAVAALLSQTAFGAGILLVSASEAGEARPLRFTAGTLLPLAYCAASVFVLGRLLPGSSLGTAATGAALYLASLLPLAPLMWRSVTSLRGQLSAGPA